MSFLNELELFFNSVDAIPTIQDNKSFATRRHVMTAWKFEYIYWTTFSVLILQFLSLALLFAVIYIINY